VRKGHTAAKNDWDALAFSPGAIFGSSEDPRHFHPFGDYNPISCLSIYDGTVLILILLLYQETGMW
jgi:hypothetical protein